MKKFKVLKYHESILLKVGIFENQLAEKEKPSDGFFKSAIIYYSLFISVTFFISSSLFVHQNLVEFNVALRTCITTVGVIQVMGMFINFYSNAANNHAVHFKLQELVDRSIDGMCFFMQISVH